MSQRDFLARPVQLYTHVPKKSLTSVVFRQVGQLEIFTTLELLRLSSFSAIHKLYDLDVLEGSALVTVSASLDFLMLRLDAVWRGGR